MSLSGLKFGKIVFNLEQTWFIKKTYDYELWLLFLDVEFEELKISLAKHF